MGDKSKIEWCEATWNPIRARNIETGGVGHYCEKVSPGCANCYAERMQPRFKNSIRYNAADGKLVEVYLDEEVLLQPLRWKRPRAIFPCSMTDLFGAWVPDAWLDKIFAVMALANWHTFQVVTKRARRQMSYMRSSDRKRDIASQTMYLSNLLACKSQSHEARIKVQHFSKCFDGSGPFTNIWLGVSVEDQKTADQRISWLLDTPAAIRWASYEPALGGVDFTKYLYTRYLHGGDHHEYERLDWIVVGGESGQRARPFNIAWAQETVGQCDIARVPVFVKQLGAKPYVEGAMNWPIATHAPRTMSDFNENRTYAYLENRKGSDMNEWPDYLRVRQYPKFAEVTA